MAALRHTLSHSATHTHRFGFAVDARQRAVGAQLVAGAQAARALLIGFKRCGARALLHGETVCGELKASYVVSEKRKTRVKCVEFEKMS